MIGYSVRLDDSIMVNVDTKDGDSMFPEPNRWSHLPDDMVSKPRLQQYMYVHLTL
jgi:hypothetical protein